MPNLTSHLGIALEAVRSWKHPILERNLGSYLLGAASPDIRIITRQPRQETHFAPLDSETVDAGFVGMLERHPRLARAKGLSEETQAFIAGYITHLVSDQVWIIDMYRPFFGNPKVFEDRTVGNVMDRALQMAMDRRDRPVWEKTVSLLDTVESHIDVDFIPPQVLKEWRQWVQEYPDRGFAWERLRAMARHQYPEGNHQAQEAVERFLESVCEGLEQIYQRVPRGKVKEFRRRSIAEFTRVIEEYLG